MLWVGRWLCSSDHDHLSINNHAHLIDSIQPIVPSVVSVRPVSPCPSMHSCAPIRHLLKTRLKNRSMAISAAALATGPFLMPQSPSPSQELLNPRVERLQTAHLPTVRLQADAVVTVDRTVVAKPLINLLFLRRARPGSRPSNSKSMTRHRNSSFLLDS